ncbi:hypothetical protein SLEP1_g52457 [Rubroshorea leprosula]|uniref:NAC domain-containing protein n=1 Tax=Rubroshorea leprosula TaxID=152421 RepID=A0AAV5M6F8_9ROSI|nr:hypothetical protein SLEP1_g52457 [Rubroshorea leprosula]
MNSTTTYHRQDSSCDNKKLDADDGQPLPGFRFHPTDEELLAFYLRRKVEKKPLRIELIKQIDIYKYDPWDLPIWTICRIFKRSSSQRKLYSLDQSRENSKRNSSEHHQTSYKACSMESDNRGSYISFGAPAAIDYHHFDDQKPVVNYDNNINGRSLQWNGEQCMSSDHQPLLTTMASTSSSLADLEGNFNYDHLFTYGDLDELRSVVEFALDPTFM